MHHFAHRGKIIGPRNSLDVEMAVLTSSRLPVFKAYHGCYWMTALCVRVVKALDV